MNLPEGVSARTAEVAGSLDGTTFIAERMCGQCSTVADVEVRLTTDGLTAWETWECDVDECGHENHAEYDAEDLLDPDREVGPCDDF